VPVLLLAAALLAPRAAESREALEARFRAIAGPAGGTVGVSVLHLETGKGASLHGHDRFPMASVFKLAVAVELLSRTDRGAVVLDRRIAIAPADLRPGQSPIAERAPPGGLTMTIGELLEAMLVDGDNTAADLLLPLAGGPEVVTAQLDANGLGDIRVDRSEIELAFDAFGVASPPPRSAWTLPALRRAFEDVPAPARASAFAAFLADPRDTATPDTLVQLLRQIAEGRRLTPVSRDLLLSLLARTRPGGDRLKAGVPAGTPVAHRTGTGADFGAANIATNDVGLVTLPNGRGRLAIAVMIKGSSRPLADRERAIAAIARAAWDYWTR
jgi:beta-lactamase class A